MRLARVEENCHLCVFFLLLSSGGFNKRKRNCSFDICVLYTYIGRDMDYICIKTQLSQSFIIPSLLFQTLMMVMLLWSGDVSFINIFDGSKMEFLVYVLSIIVHLNLWVPLTSTVWEWLVLKGNAMNAQYFYHLSITNKSQRKIGFFSFNTQLKFHRQKSVALTMK